MKRKYREYSDEDFTSAISQSRSIAGVLYKLNLRPTGGNYKTVKSLVRKLNLDVSHFSGQGWRIGKYQTFEGLTSKTAIKSALIRERNHKCEICQLSKWRDKPIPLELDHIDGDNTNNAVDNLRLLCCNCHAQTPTWRNQKRIPDG